MPKKIAMLLSLALAFSVSFLVGFKNADVVEQPEKLRPKLEVQVEKTGITTIRWANLDIESNIASHPPEALCFAFNGRKKITLLPLVAEGQIGAKLPNGKYHLEIYTCRVVRLSIPQLIFLSLPQIIADFEVNLKPPLFEL